LEVTVWAKTKLAVNSSNPIQQMWIDFPKKPDQNEFMDWR
jgi:hypothetical protein